MWMIPLCVFAILGTTMGAGWNYDRCDNANGPTSSAWGGYCSGQSENSPVDVCGAEKYNLPRLQGTDWCTTRQLKIKNNGHTIQVGVIDDPPTTTAGTISKLVGRGSSDTPAIWQLEQVHFHWGRAHHDEEGSEHYLNGKPYPLEAHFVHFNTKHGKSVGEVVGTAKPDSLLVVGVFFDLNSLYPSEPRALTQIANAVQNASHHKDKYIDLNQTVQLSTIYEAVGDYYTYAGGLTTPTCNEVMPVLVVKAPLIIVARPSYPRHYRRYVASGLFPPSASSSCTAHAPSMHVQLWHNTAVDTHHGSFRGGASLLGTVFFRS